MEKQPQTANAEAIKAANTKNISDMNAQSAGSDPKDDAIRTLQAELDNVKAILKSFETPQTLENQTFANADNFASDLKKQIAAADFQKVDRLVSFGRITPQQGTILKQEILQKAFGDGITNSPAPTEPQTQTIDQAFDEFEKSNPGFFSKESRKLVKEYLKNGLESISSEELTKIVELVKAVEETVIKDHEQCKALEKAVAEGNDEAKKRLTGSALNGSKPSGVSTSAFTRDEIGKMSADEFIKNEPAIMDQLKKGLIK